jgi:hypothetical protein
MNETWNKENARLALASAAQHNAATDLADYLLDAGDEWSAARRDTLLERYGKARAYYARAYDARAQAIA